MAVELKEGMAAPDFQLAASTGGELSLRELRGRPVVLYFYPKDDTPGCTREACAFRDGEAELRRLGAAVLGVSRDSLPSHERFADKYQLNFPLLSDPDGLAVGAYGAWKPGSEGAARGGVDRTTFLVDAGGTIRRIWRSVKVDGHDQEVLAALEEVLAQGTR